ncbi:hypothetical protein [Aeromonas veronii]|uniref:hypothetical protein n=1 Tax=Aeromonas veronii TaxID=654 RepID=UPI000390DE1C|nr:hypothetical protein [Aeromonas veronii]QMS76428.1 hypothetical protein M001_020755 [Aeromonas veronii Hm21]
MITPTHCLPTRRQQQRDEEQRPQEECVERFQALLGDIPLPPLRAARPHDPHRATRAMPAPAPREQEPARARPPLPETLQLRAASGPLAGLMINAGWQGGRLVMRLTAPSASVAQRLCGRGKGLEEALSSLLEIPVTVEVDHDN